MRSELKAVVKAALQQYRGDDHIRAQYAFAGFTAEQMQQPHGYSGMTRQQVLDGYMSRVKSVDDAIAEIDSL